MTSPRNKYSVVSWRTLTVLVLAVQAVSSSSTEEHALVARRGPLEEPSPFSIVSYHCQGKD